MKMSIYIIFVTADRFFPLRFDWQLRGFITAAQDGRLSTLIFHSDRRRKRRRRNELITCRPGIYISLA
jgi:hypothetical protein